MPQSQPKPIPPLDLEGLAYYLSGEYQSDPRYLAHLEAQQATNPTTAA